MLAKLLKYELKSTARTMLPFYAALIVLAIVNRVAFLFQSPAQFLRISQAVLVVMYGLFIAAIFIMTILVVLQRFYKNLLGQEGYLMFTIPVTPAQNLLSKAIVSLLWFLCSFVCVFISVLILIPSFESFPIFLRELSYAFERVRETLHLEPVLLIWMFAALLLFSVIQFIFEVYTAICIGQLANDHKILASFGAYVGIYTLLQIINSVLLSLFALPMFDKLHFSAETPAQVGPYAYTLMAFLLVETVILIVVYFLVDRHLLAKKLNLE